MSVYLYSSVHFQKQIFELIFADYVSPMLKDQFNKLEEKIDNYTFLLAEPLRKLKIFILHGKYPTVSVLF